MSDFRGWLGGSMAADAVLVIVIAWLTAYCLQRFVTQIRKLPRGRLKSLFATSWCSVVRLWSIVLMAFGLGVAFAQPSSEAVLKSFDVIKGLSAEEAEKGHPIQVEATILFAHSSEGWFVHFLDDGTTGIYVRLSEWRGDLAAGDRVVVRGVTGSGDFAPVINDGTIELIASGGRLPNPLRPTFRDLARGVSDSQWVSVTGTVRSARWDRVHVVLELVLRNHRYRATVLGYPEGSAPVELIGSEVEIHGVYAPRFNKSRQLTGFHLYVPGTEHVSVSGEMVSDPFQFPMRPVAELLGFQDRERANRLVHVEGGVQLVISDQIFYLTDGKAGVRVESIEPHTLRPGDGVEIVGFAELGHFSPILQDCQVRPTGSSQDIVPVKITAEDTLSGSYEASLISVSGRLINVGVRGELPVLTLQAAGRYFDVEVYDSLSPGSRRRLLPGSEIEVTGVCAVKADAEMEPIGFSVLVENEGDIRVMSSPSWWTLRNTLMVVGGLVLLVAFVVAWGVTLQRRVSQQTAIIRDEYEKQAELERQYLNLFENANDMVFAIDEKGFFTVLNRAGERLLGLKREEAKAKRFEDLVASADLEEMRVVLEPNRRATGERRTELRLDRLGERHVEVEVSFRGIWEEGQLKGFEGIARDLTERKKAEAELEAAQKELLVASRQAGMAEVATGVLHNVGNVLNSVNVSGQTALQQTKEMRVDSLAKVVALLEANREEPGFLSNDPKGQKIPEYLKQLTEHLASDRNGLLEELKALLESVEHTKDIVSMQQAYARTGQVRDKVYPEELVEDAIRLNAGALTRHEVTLVRDFKPTPKITIDRTRILQVLINLIRNAKYACDEAAGDEKTLTIAIAPREQGIRVSVADTGVGIPKENLTKIFAYGFTTRKEGHGFGLHSSSLAAKEVGGELSVESPGRGKGAVFHLDLPIRAEEETS